MIKDFLKYFAFGSILGVAVATLFSMNEDKEDD